MYLSAVFAVEFFQFLILDCQQMSSDVRLNTGPRFLLKIVSGVIYIYRKYRRLCQYLLCQTKIYVRCSGVGLSRLGYTT